MSGGGPLATHEDDTAMFGSKKRKIRDLEGQLREDRRRNKALLRAVNSLRRQQGLGREMKRGGLADRVG
jgi:hypothetical protein